MKFETGRDLALAVLKSPTARDLQKKIGASQFSSLCARCVALDLVAPEPDEEFEAGRYWLGATIGTGVHAVIEDMIPEVLSDPIIERKVFIGHLEGYGDIHSKPDLYYGEDKRVVDWKTTDRAKMKYIKLVDESEPDDTELTVIKEMRFKVRGYYGQIQTYAKAMKDAGHDVERVSIVFINRDGKTDKDIYSLDYDYDEDYANRLWARLERIWAHVRDGGDVLDIPAHDHCYCQR